jgi:chromosomal replication initiation ATPase DnaA
VRDSRQARIAKQVTCFAFGVRLDEIEAKSRGTKAASDARQVAMYLTHVAFEMPLYRVGDCFDRDRATAAHACHKVEDRRDDADFDRKLDELEYALRALPEPQLRW